MATALRPVMPMENEAMLIESAMYARRTVMQERVREMSYHGVPRGREVRIEALLRELSTHIAGVCGCTIEEARHDWNELMLQAEDALTFLEDQAIAVRVDIQHKVVTRV
jgi:hypothetical protein